MTQNNVKNLKVRKVYGKPLSRLSQGVPIDEKSLKEFAKIIVKSIRDEAKKDAAMRKPKGRGIPVPMSPAHEIAKSIKFRISGKSTLEFYSDHPLIRAFTEGMAPYPMPWLTKQAGVDIVPMITQQGLTIFRVAPLTKGEAWIHPGFLKYNFFERGTRKGREKAASQMYERVIAPQLAKSDLLL